MKTESSVKEMVGGIANSSPRLLCPHSTSKCFGVADWPFGLQPFLGHVGLRPRCQDTCTHSLPQACGDLSDFVSVAYATLMFFLDITFSSFAFSYFYI